MAAYYDMICVAHLYVVLFIVLFVYMYIIVSYHIYPPIFSFVVDTSQLYMPGKAPMKLLLSKDKLMTNTNPMIKEL